MTPSAACDAAGPAGPAAAPATALGAALDRLRRRASRTVAFMVVLCLAIALLLTAFEQRALGPHLIYSFAIGWACWTFNEATRLLLAWLTDRLRNARGLPLHSAGFDKGWRGIAPALLVCVLAGPPLGLALGDFITGYESPSLLQLNAHNTRMTLALTLIAAVTTVFVLSTMERLSSARTQAEAAQRLAAENQLRLLQSQLEPHMLFNTLANLRVLIGLDPPRAQAMLDRMIGFLRATLDASRVGLHPLAAEFERLADYLALMAVRMGPRLALQLDLPPELSGLAVPPLLLQPLVENAIKHGLEPKVDGGRISVSARRAGATLQLLVRDTGVGLGGAATMAGAGAVAGTSFGLEQVRARLATLYGSNAALTLQPAADADGGVLALVTLPMPLPLPLPLSSAR